MPFVANRIRQTSRIGTSSDDQGRHSYRVECRCSAANADPVRRAAEVVGDVGAGQSAGVAGFSTGPKSLDSSVRRLPRALVEITLPLRPTRIIRGMVLIP